MMYLSTASLMSWYEYDMNLRKKSSFVKIVQENVFFLQKLRLYIRTFATTLIYPCRP